jgi:predicted kinase
MWSRKHNIYNKLDEHLVDSLPQMIFVMGLPAAGKSYFIKNDLPKFFPSLKGDNRLLDVDIQLEDKQKQFAAEFASYLYSMREYLNNSNLYYKIIENKEEEVNRDPMMAGRDDFYISTSYEWFIEHKNLSEKKFVYKFLKEFFKSDWASNFVPRPDAKKIFKELSKQKLGVREKDITFNDNNIVIPITGDSLDKFLDFAQMSFGNYVPSIVYLDLPIEEAIKRDKMRRKKEGRGVGEDLIRKKSTPIKQNYEVLLDYGYLDYNIYKIMKFVWQPNDTPFGEYVLDAENCRKNVKMIKNALL